MTLRDEMAELMPGLKWTRPVKGVASGAIGCLAHVRVAKHWFSHRHTVSVPGWRGVCQSPAHAAKTIRRKLAQFIVIFGKALEEMKT